MERAVGVNVDKEISLYLLPGEVKEENEEDNFAVELYVEGA